LAHRGGRGILHRRLKRAVPIAQQNANVLAEAVCYRKIHVAVSSEIGGRDPRQRLTTVDFVIHRRPERSVTIAQQNCNLAQSNKGDGGDIQLAVVIEVPDRDS
jgi:hypothetical protein